MKTHFLYVFLWCCWASLCKAANNASPSAVIPVNITTAISQSVSVDSQMPDYAVASDFGRNTSDNGNSGRKTLLTLLVSNAYGGEMPVGAISTKAMELALDRLKQQPNWLPDYEVALELIDDECVDSTTINRIVPKLRENDEALNRLPLWLSPACEAFGLRTVAEAINYFNFVGVSTIQTSLEPFLNRRRFNSFFSLAERYDLPHIALADFIAKMGWKKVAILSEKFPYYDELEKTLLPLLDAANVTLTWIGKISHAGVFEEEIQPLMEELIVLDPRIIIVNADRGAGKACWLHRYGMYGPNYVTFFFYWSDVYPTPAVPGNIDWCTVDMINEVMASSIILGDTTIVETYGGSIADSSGITGQEWEMEMELKVDHPLDSPFWTYWRLMGYDVTLFGGFVLNTTESILRSRGETLADWVTSSDKFSQNGSIIADIFKRAIYLTKVKGLKGEYDFEQSTKVNSRGYTPVTFSQLQSNDNETQGVLIAVYKSNAPQKFVIFTDRIVWATEDGLPPFDSLQVVMVEVPSVTVAQYSVLTGFAGLAELFCLALLLLAMYLQFFPTHPSNSLMLFNFEDLAVIVGNMAMLCQIFALPLGAHGNISQHVIVMAVCLLFGYSTSIFGKLTILNNGRKSYGYSFVRGSRRISHQVRQQSSGSTRGTKLLIGLLFWLVIQAALFGSFLTVAPLKSVPVNMTLAKPQPGARIANLSYQYQCHFAIDVLSNNTALGLVVTLAAIQFVALFLTAYNAYVLRSGLRRSMPRELKSNSNSIYCVILIFVAGIFIAVLVKEHVYIVLSSINLSYVLVSSVFTAIPKFSRGMDEKPGQRRVIFSVTVTAGE